MNSKLVTLLLSLICFITGAALGTIYKTSLKDNFIEKQYAPPTSIDGNSEITNNLWLLISIRSFLDKAKTTDAEELLDVEISNLLTTIRQDQVLVQKISSDKIWRSYLSRIGIIWKNTPPFSSESFKSQSNQDWYSEFIENNNQNQKFLDHMKSQ